MLNSIGKCLSVTLFCFPIILLASPKQDMRGARHCEIIISKSKLNFSVYSTVGLNDCPENKWHDISVARVKRETGALFVHLNGPRYWLVDGYEPSQSHSEQRQFGGVLMHETGVLHLSLLDLIKGAAPYREHKVDRQTTWIYKGGQPIYELIDPKGHVFVMQSYMRSLSNLDSKLKLPTGWHFRTRVLKKDAFLTALNNQAVVIQDGFLNTYQLETQVM